MQCGTDLSRGSRPQTETLPRARHAADRAGRGAWAGGERRSRDAGPLAWRHPTAGGMRMSPDRSRPQPEPGSVAGDLPVREIPGDDPHAELLEAPALCLSGGGSRAMLFHVGALWRMNELGLLGKLGRVSSVSGGSITAGVLATRWARLAFDPASRAASHFAEVVA